MKPLTHKKLIEHELEGFGIRINKTPPDIKFSKKDKGGINMSSSCPQSTLDLETVCEIIGAEMDVSAGWFSAILLWTTDVIQFFPF